MIVIIIQFPRMLDAFDYMFDDSSNQAAAVAAKFASATWCVEAQANEGINYRRLDLHKSH
jgi:hypothetical protein